MPPIPIIILNWNGLADTQECLASLEQQTYQNYLVYLVDNGSDIPESTKLRELYSGNPKVKLRPNEQNLGFTRGNNQILREILDEALAPPYIVLLNNDTEVAPPWLEELLQTAEQEKADLVASKMINYYARERMDNAGHFLLNTLEILPLGHDEPVNKYKEPLENIGPCAGAALYRTDMLRKIGLFDEHFTNGYEDVELGLRAIVCGYRSVFAPKAVVYHKISQSINKIRDFDYTVNIQRHIYYIIAKLVPTGAFWICFPFLLFRTFAGLLVNALFLRGKFLRIQFQAIRWVFLDGRTFLGQSRKKFFKNHHVIPSYRLLSKMEFFLKKDMQRFYKYLIRGEKMVFEKYD